MNLHLEGKTALVTASTAGIGFAIAQALAEEGTDVILNGRTQKRVEQARRQIAAEVPHARTSGIAADLSTAAGVQQVTDRFESIDAHLGQGSGKVHGRRRLPRDDDGGMVRVFRDQRDERRETEPALPPADEEKQLGSDRLHLQRIGTAHSIGDDSLRRNQDGPDRAGAGTSRNHPRDRCDCQLRAAGTDPL